MRFRAGSTLIYPLLLALTVSSGVALNSGCGGGSSSPKPSSGGSASPSPSPSPTSTPNQAPVNVKPTVIWAPRSRQEANAVSGPSSALSVRLTLTVPGKTDTPVDQIFNRDVPATGGREVYTTTNPVTPGIYVLTAEFHALTNGQGPVVGTAAASATVNPDGTLTVTIATFGTIQSVQVVPNQSVKIGQTTTVQYACFDKDGNAVAVTPGSGFVQVADATSTVSGQPSIQVQGENVTGLNPFHAQIRVAVDNAISSAVDIKVLSNVTLDVNPKNAVISVLQPAVFSATVGNDGPTGANGVVFSIQEGSIAGTLTQPNSTTANFTAGGLSSQGNYHLVATSVYDPNVSVVIPFSVQSLVTVAVTPSTVPDTSFKGGTQKFTATVSLVPQGQDQTVTWSVSPANAGTITSDGLFTAGDYQGPVTVRATSNFDTTKFGEVAFTVKSLTAVAITTTPPAGGISIKTGFTFAAQVTGVPAGQDTSVAWSLAPAAGTPDGANLGTIDGNGNYTAPALPVNVIVTATSNFDKTKSASVPLSVKSFVQVQILDPNPITVSIDSQHKFTVKQPINGVPTGADQSVTWSIAAGPAGASVDPATGVFTAPGTSSDFTIKATSNFDPTKSATVLVHVRDGNLGVGVN